MNKSESKYFATARKMDEALLELLDEKELPYITVKEICARAHVNRSTFYLHYETIQDLLSESVRYLNDRFLEHMRVEPASFVDRIRERPVEELYLVDPVYLVPYLRFIQEHARLFKTAMRNADVLQLQKSYGGMMRHVFTPILERLSVPIKRRPYIMAFYVSGLVAVITEWLDGGCATPIEEIVCIMQDCVVSKGRKP